MKTCVYVYGFRLLFLRWLPCSFGYCGQVVSTVTHRPMTPWPHRLLTLHIGLRRGVHKSQAPFRRGNYIFYSGAQCLWIPSLGLASNDPSGA